MTIKTRTVLAVGVLAASWPPALASVLLSWIFELPETPVERAFLAASPAEVAGRFDELGVTIALIYGALSALLLARRPHPVAVILAVHAVGSAVAAFGVQWGLLAERVESLPAAGLLGHAAGWAYVPGTFATTIVPLLVLAVSRNVARRAIAWFGTGIALAGTIVTLSNQSPSLPPNPFAIQLPGYQAALPALYQSLATTAVVISVIVTVVLTVEVMRSGPRTRPRLAWLLAGHVFLTLSYAALILPGDIAVPDAVWAFGSVAPAIGQVFYPAAVLVIVLGNRLEGIDAVVSRVLTGAVLACVAAAAYLAVYASLISWTELPIGVIGTIAVGTVAVALQPAWALVRRHVDKLVYPAGDDPTAVVQRLGERAGQIDSGADGLRAIADGLRVALRLGSVEIRRDRFEADPAPHTTTTDVSIPLRAGDSRLGALVVRPRDGERLSRRARRQLAELAGPIAMVVQLADANAVLEKARADVVAARHAERRILRSELHDGVGPALAGVVYGLAAVEKLLPRDAAAARELASRLARDLQDRAADVATVAEDLESAAPIDDLEVELRRLLADFAGARAELSLAVEPAAVASVAVPVQRSMRLIAAEAVLNAVRHSGARRISVELRLDGREVLLSVADDGNGILPGANPGIGLASMKERAAATGSFLDIQSSAGHGTRVCVRAPVLVSQEARS